MSEQAKGHKQERQQHTVQDEDVNGTLKKDAEAMENIRYIMQAHLAGIPRGDIARSLGPDFNYDKVYHVIGIGNRGWIGVKDRKVHSVIPKPASKSVAERLDLMSELSISLSEDTKEMLESVKQTMQTETHKTRTVLIVLDASTRCRS